jgi:hypothetical protein
LRADAKLLSIPPAADSVSLAIATVIMPKKKVARSMSEDIKLSRSRPTYEFLFNPLELNAKAT